MKKSAPRIPLKIKIDPPEQILVRTARVIRLIHYTGTPLSEIRRLTDDKVLSLINGAQPQLRRPQFKALQRHFDVNLLYLWTGKDSEFCESHSL